MKNKPAPEALAATDRPVVEIAGLRRRLASMLYEVLLLLGVLGLFYMLPNVLMGMAWNLIPGPLLQLLWVFLVCGAYFVYYWHRHGSTLAMQTWRLKVVDARDGRLPGLWRAALRYAVAWPSLYFLGVGILWAILDRDRQFLHDRLAGTCVVLMPPRQV